MFMALCHHQDIIGDIFIDHVPGFFAAGFGAANTQTFTLTQRMVHQALVFADHFSFGI